VRERGGMRTRATPLNGESEMRLRMRNIRDTFPVSAFWPRYFGRAWGCEAERTFSITHSGVGCGSLCLELSVDFRTFLEFSIWI
jgi:hypothetical protein